MGKILIIGVGNGAREAVKHMKNVGIPEANYIIFGTGTLGGDDEKSEIPHYDLIRMNGHNGISLGWEPEEFKCLAENVKDDIRDILEYHINGVNSKDNEKH